MSANADDLRYWFGEDLGDTTEVTVAAATSTPLSDEKLSPGRYVLRILDFGTATDVWVRQGANGAVQAAALAPATRFRPHTDVRDLNRPVWSFIVRAGGTGSNPSTARDQLAFFAVGGGAVIVQVTKISRDKQ